MITLRLGRLSGILGALSGPLQEKGLCMRAWQDYAKYQNRASWLAFLELNTLRCYWTLLAG